MSIISLGGSTFARPNPTQLTYYGAFKDLDQKGTSSRVPILIASFPPVGQGGNRGPSSSADDPWVRRGISIVAGASSRIAGEISGGHALQRVKVYCQNNNASMFSAIKSIYNVGGLKSFQQGFVSSVQLNGTKGVLKLGVFTEAKQCIKELYGPQLKANGVGSTTLNFFLGLGVGIFESTLLVGLERNNVSSMSGSKKGNVALGATWCRAGAYNSTYFVVQQGIVSEFGKSDSKLGSFISGGVAGMTAAVASIVPDNVKTKMQSNSEATYSKVFTQMLTEAKANPVSLVRGVVPKMVRYSGPAAVTQLWFDWSKNLMLGALPKK
jgi:hypothetical protein